MTRAACGAIGAMQLARLFARPKEKIMNSQEWVEGRTTSELIEWHRLLTCLESKEVMQHAQDRMAGGAKDLRLPRIEQLENEIRVRQARHIGFMDRLDGKDNPA